MQRGSRMVSASMLLVIGFCLVGMSGCGGADQKPAPPADSDSGQEQASSAESKGPKATIHDFLEAARTGDDATATALLTPVAREKIEDLGGSVAPPSSDTARFALGEVQMLADDGARVPSVWTDLDGAGQEKSYKMLWMVRRVEEGWRVAGMAAEVFPGEPPLLLDFENPEEVVQKQQMLREEIRRRTEQAVLESQQAETHKDSIRR